MVCLLRYAVRRRWSGTAYVDCASVWYEPMIRSTPGPENGNPEAILPSSRGRDQFFGASHVDPRRGDRWQQPVLPIFVLMDRTTTFYVKM
jgi:hypothetical protein